MSGVSEHEVWAALSRIIDPELDCDIVAVGLVYGVHIEDGHVAITMTFTTPGCPMNEILPAAVKSTVRELPGVSEVSVEVTWDPPWNFSMLSESARERLGVPDGP